MAASLSNRIAGRKGVSGAVRRSSGGQKTERQTEAQDRRGAVPDKRAGVIGNVAREGESEQRSGNSLALGFPARKCRGDDKEARQQRSRQAERGQRIAPR